MIGTTHDPFQPSEYSTSLLTALSEHCRAAKINRFLEVGVGSGLLSVFVARESGASGVGLDIDPAALERTGKLAEKAGVSGLELRLNTGDDPFAAIASGECCSISCFANLPTYPGV